MADVIMPKMGDAMTEGKVLAWRKQVGDQVRRGESIAEIETDKVNVEIGADADGTLADIVVPEGGTAPVGSVIAHINGAEQGRAAPQPHPDKAAAPPRQDLPVGPRREAAEPHRDRPPGPRPDGPRRVEGEQDGEVPRASPLARRLAAERGVDLKGVHGTGPSGRIVERDVLAAAEGAPKGERAGKDSSGEARTGVPAAARPVECPVPVAPAGTGDYEDVALPRMRQAIALSVARSMQVTPHFYVSGEVDMGRALEVRAQLKEAYGDDEGRVTINDLILKATALALRRRPDLNSQFIEPKMLRRFHRVHLGIMVAVPDGLVVPVLRDADRLTLLEVAREAHRLIGGAQRRQLKSEESTGATFSVSNLGMYPVGTFAAIISAPQAGILAVGRVEDRPAVRDGRIVARPIMGVTISADHRVTDGVGAAALLAEVKRLLENPLLLMAG